MKPQPAILPKGIGYHVGFDFRRAKEDTPIVVTDYRKGQACFKIDGDYGYTRRDLVKIEGEEPCES